MQTLSLTEKAWKGASKDSPQNGGGIDQASHQGATSREHLHGVKTLLARVRRIPAQMHTTKWIFSRESTRVAVEIPITISGIDEDGHVFREATHTLDVSRRGAKISSSNLLAVGTYLWIKTSNGEKPFVARVVRHGAQNHPDDSCEICVTLPEVDGAGTIWDIQSPPEDWKTGCGQPSAAKRLERIYARDWATKFESISEAADCSTALAEDAESESTPTHTSASAAPQVSPSQFEVLPGEGLSLVVGQPQKTAQSSVSTAVRRDEVTPSTSHQAREVATSDIEERLKRVSLAMDSLEARMGALLEDFQGRMEGTLQAFQGKDAKRAEDLEKAAQELAGRWSQQLQEQAEAAVAKLREEVKSSGQVVEESEQQLASLVEAKLASLSQATREEYSQQLAQAFQEQAQAIHAATDAEMKLLKQAAEEVLAQLRDAEQKKETSLATQAKAAEDRLAGVFLAVDALMEKLQGKSGNDAEDSKKIAQEFGARFSQECQKQAEAAMEKVRKEVRNSGQIVEESKRQLANLAEAKLASLNQVAAKAVSGLEAEQKRLKTKYESSQKDLEDLVARRLARLSTTSLRRAIPSKGRDIATRLGLVAVLFMIMVASLLAVSGSTHSVMQLQSEAPAQFIEQNPTWNAKRRAREEEMAQAYWRTAVLDVQERYPFGSQLPVDPPDEFQVDIKYVPTGGAKALAESRALYWEKLRATWGQREVWVESQEADTTLGARFRHIWEEIKAKFA